MSYIVTERYYEKSHLRNYGNPTANRTAVIILKCSVCMVISLFILSSPLQASSSGSGYPGSIQQSTQPIRIGVLDLDPLNISQGDSESISARLRHFLGQQSVFGVMERKRMNDILDEQGFQISGACTTDDECVIEVGQILGVNKMVAGEVSVVGSVFSLQIRLVDISTSRIEFSIYRDVTGIEQVLQVATEDIAEELSRLVAGAVKITFQNNLSGISLSISGDEDHRLTLRQQVEWVLLDPGSYHISLSAPGYRPWQRDVELQRNDMVTYPISLVPKSRGLAGLYSLVLPGLGQLYEGRKGMAFLTFLATSGTATFVLKYLDNYSTLESQYESLQKDFLNATDPAEIPAIQAAISDTHQELETSRDKLDLFIKILGGLWVANVLDSMLNMPRLNTISNSNMGIRLSSGYHLDRLELRISFPILK